MPDRKLDLWLDTSFQESRHEDEVAMSFNDQRVLSVYEQSKIRVGQHHAVALSFKKGKDPIVPNNKILSLLKGSFSRWSEIIKFPRAIARQPKIKSDLFASKHAVVLSNDEVDESCVVLEPSHSP